MTKHQPTTPLPWNMQDGGRSNLAHVEREADGTQVCSINKKRVKDAAYIQQSCNAYPKLVEALRVQCARWEELEKVVFGSDGWKEAEGRALLRELGEQE